MNPLKLEAHIKYETHRYQKEREALQLVTQATKQRRYERRQAVAKRSNPVNPKKASSRAKRSA